MPDTPSPLGKDLVRAAEHCDHLAFAALAERLGTLEQAQEIVRKQAFVRMADRVAVPNLAKPAIREAEPETSSEPTLHGHFAVFDEWTEINSIFEGHFLERIAPKAFKKTFQILTPRVTFQHGQDPYLGDKILGKIERLEEDETGAAYEVPLFRGLPDLLMEGLRADQYGASFRFRVMREEFEHDPDESEYNPAGLPERTLKELQVPEFGPVTYPAYASATAGVRSGEEVASAPSKVDAAEEEHLQESGRSSENGTSSEERSVTQRTWPKVTDEEWDQLWNPLT